MNKFGQCVGIGFLSFVAVACTAKSPLVSDVLDASPVDEAGGMDGGTASTTIGPRNPSCPTSQPADQSACATSELQCEYGDNYDPNCNTVLMCSGGKWGLTRTPSTTCVPKPGPNDAKCPSVSPSGPLPTGACTDAVTCSYGTTDFCSCVSDIAPCPQYPVAFECHDGGVNDDASVGRHWSCEPTPLCPTPRPAVGSACAAADALGNYTCYLEAPKPDQERCEVASLSCQNERWVESSGRCPISSREKKEEVHYLSADELAKLQKETLSTKLATYKYKEGDPNTHLGFIIEDQSNPSASVLPSRQRVDLYGYMSMAVATLQQQQKEIDALKKDLREVESKCEKGKR